MKKKTQNKKQNQKNNKLQRSRKTSFFLCVKKIRCQTSNFHFCQIFTSVKFQMLRVAQISARVKFCGSWELGAGQPCQIFNVAAGTRKLRRQSNFKKCKSWKCPYSIVSLFYYTTNFKRGQAGSRVKFSGADILLQLKF